MARPNKTTLLAKAVAYIAEHNMTGDQRTDFSTHLVSEHPSVLLVADLFDKEVIEVAKAVVHDRVCAERRKNW